VAKTALTVQRFQLFGLSLPIRAEVVALVKGEEFANPDSEFSKASKVRGVNVVAKRHHLRGVFRHDQSS
jgi:hypothetical protein